MFKGLSVMSVCVCVSVALVIQHAQGKRRLILSSIACPSLPYLCTLSHKRNFFGRKVIGHKMCVLILCTSVKLNDLYSSPNIVRVIKSRRMRWAGHVARMSEERGTYRILVGKPEGKRPLGRPRRRWLDNIRMDL